MKKDTSKSIKTFAGLFDVILNGNKEDSRKAARDVKKLLYSSGDKGKYNEISATIENAPERHRGITEDWREENFVIAVSVLYYLHDRESSPDFLFPWLIHLLLHQNGNIRNASRRMIKNELGPLTVHIRCPEYKQSKSKIEQSNIILESLYETLNDLLVDLWEPKYKKHKYVNTLPTSPYKTIQMVLCEMVNSCGEKYIKQLREHIE